MTEQEMLLEMNQMCLASLPPDTFGKWLEVKKTLRANRKNLK